MSRCPGVTPPEPSRGTTLDHTFRGASPIGRGDVTGTRVNTGVLLGLVRLGLARLLVLLRLVLLRLVIRRLVLLLVLL
ncbi:hypothetical protein, partial [Streptomyces sp. NPDC001450]